MAKSIPVSGVTTRYRAYLTAKAASKETQLREALKAVIDTGSCMGDPLDPSLPLPTPFQIQSFKGALSNAARVLAAD